MSQDGSEFIFLLLMVRSITADMLSRLSNVIRFKPEEVGNVVAQVRVGQRIHLSAAVQRHLFRLRHHNPEVWAFQGQLGRPFQCASTAAEAGKTDFQEVEASRGSPFVGFIWFN